MLSLPVRRACRRFAEALVRQAPLACEETMLQHNHREPAAGTLLERRNRHFRGKTAVYGEVWQQ